MDECINRLESVAFRRREALAFIGATAFTGGSGNALAQEAARRGGVLKAVSTVNPSSLDPGTGNSGADHAFLYTMFDSLVEFDYSTLKPKPGIAAWVFEDPKTMLLTIQPNIRFHDGTVLDASAVKFNLDRNRSAQRSSVKPDLVNVGSVDVTGPLTLKLTLKQPDSALPGILSDRAGMIASPKAVQALGKDHDRNPVGSGPWKFVSWADSQSVVVTRNESYWRGGQYLDGIEFVIIPDLATGLRSVIANQNHLAYETSPRYKPLVERASNVSLVTGPTLRHSMLYFNYGRAPLDNVKVRQAINFAIDKAGFLKVTLGGAGEVATQNLPSVHWAHDPTVAKMYPHDPARAKKLLAEAGYPNGLEITFGGAADQDSVRRRELIIANLSAVGIQCKFTSGATLTELLAPFWSEKKFDCLLAGWTGRPDPSMTYQSLYGKDSYFNAGRAELSTELTALMQESRAKDDQEYRRQVFAKIQKIVMELALSCPLAFQDDTVALGSTVRNFRSNLLAKPKFQDVWLAAK